MFRALVIMRVNELEINSVAMRLIKLRGWTITSAARHCCPREMHAISSASDISGCAWSALNATQACMGAFDHRRMCIECIGQTPDMFEALVITRVNESETSRIAMRLVKLRGRGIALAARDCCPRHVLAIS